MTFKYLLVAALIVFSVVLVRMPGIGSMRKGLIFALVAIMLVFAVRPEWSQSAAQAVGIARGVDLLFYLSHLTLFLLAFLAFLKLKRMELRMTKLVRQIALEPGRSASPSGSPAADEPQEGQRTGRPA